MAKYWSPSKLAFYDSALMAESAMPSDKVALTDTEYNTLIAAQTAGKKITHDSSTGKPQATDQGLTAATSTSVNSSTTATQLTTARTIDGVDFNGTAAITHYATCSTAAATAAKVVSLTGFKLVTGARVTVRFTVTNTASSPTLNVNSTGAKAIQYRNAAITAGYLAANRVYEFVYDGSAYELVGDLGTAATATPLVAGTAAVGTSDKYAREDHVHPAQTTVSGNAGSATKLATARTIAISGGATGTATSFDGSANITIPVTALDVSKASAGTLAVARGGTGVTANPSMLVNLASTTADTVFEASPRPGVTGVLPVANGGTGSSTKNFVDLTNAQTIAGKKTFSSTIQAGLEGFIVSTSDSSAVRISGGSAYESGASVIVYGKSHASYPGYLRIRTTDGTNTADLDGAPNGSLTWNGQNIVRSVNGTKANSAGNVSTYGTCSTAAATAAKTVALTGFTLVTGAEVTVRFTVTNTASSPTLNVNSTGAKAIRYRNAAITAGYLAANRTYKFVYDGTYYQLIGDVDTNSTSYLPLAGGTMTGAIKTAVEGIIVGTNTTSGRRISGGTGWDDGASVVVYGSTHGTYPGHFRIKADNGTNEAILQGTPAGALTWGGNNVLRSRYVSERGESAGDWTLTGLKVGNILKLVGFAWGANAAWYLENTDCSGYQGAGQQGFYMLAGPRVNNVNAEDQIYRGRTTLELVITSSTVVLNINQVTAMTIKAYELFV